MSNLFQIKDVIINLYPIYILYNNYATFFKYTLYK